LTHPSEIKPLSLTFPYPILTKNFQATLHRKTQHVDLLLKKSLLEPWPCEFHKKNSKLIIEDLVPWKNEPLTSEGGLNSLNIVEHYLSCQFLSKDFNLVHYFDSKSSALESLRFKLVALMSGNSEFVSYGRNDDWYLLKLHRPLLTSPMGTPILLITALDDSLTLKLRQKFFSTDPTVLKEELDHCVILTKVFPIGAHKDKYVVDADTEEEFQLFRFLLRLNSTR
jgi:hypothetical protein